MMKAKTYMKGMTQFGQRKSVLAGAILLALLPQIGQAVTSTNAVGPIHGRQITVTADPTLSGSGVYGTSVTVVVPATADLDGDVVADWRYRWMLENSEVAPESAAGSTTVIPPYAVQIADAGKKLKLCLKAEANRGYPVATKLSDERCSSELTIPAITASITDPGAQSIAENNQYAISLTASAPGTPTFAWSIVGGADQTDFNIDPSTGELTMAAQNFEAKSDADANNTYEVTVQALDSVTNATAQRTLQVAVTDVGEALTASVTADTNNAVADGTANNVTTLLLLDDAGNPVVGQAVAISTSKGTLSAVTGSSDADGKVTVNLSHTVAEDATITYTWTGPDSVEESKAQNVTFTIGGVASVAVVDAGGAALPNPIIQGQVLHTSTALVGEGIEQVDRAGLTYTWQRSDMNSGTAGAWTDIAGATNATYTTTAADQGYQFRVTATKP